jgi:alpha-glucosidase
MSDALYAFHHPLYDRDCRDDHALITLKLQAPVPPKSVWLRSEPDNEEKLTPLAPLGNDGPWQHWQGALQPNPSDPVTRYAFKVVTEGGQYWLDASGHLTPYPPERDRHFRYRVDYEPARWVWEQVFYQIFPERFCDGDPSNNVTVGAYLYEGKPVVAKGWDELPEKGQGPREFFGGDLQGIEQKLDYLQDLGVSALYLNPIFTSPSSHKYDTVDYYQVDPHLGGNEAFLHLCQALRARGMRLILDAVVNHTSERHPWFDRYGEHASPGAYRSRQSPTYAFYTFADAADPESYHGWYGVKTLPVLNYADPELRRRIYEADDAVLRYWLREPYRIDGWRFDVIHMLGEGAGAKNNHRFVKHFRRTLREENPEAYVLGEHFFEASDWLQGDEEDAAMNYYGFTLPLWAFLGGVDHRGHRLRIDAADFEAMLARARAKLPFEIQLSQFNLLSSHDTPRMLTLLGGDEALMQVAFTLLFSYIGVPCLYYGDEIGMEGEGDPDCRRPFIWDEARWNKRLWRHCQALAALRRASPALQRGALVPLLAQGDVYAFARVQGREVIVTAVNRGEATSVRLPVRAAGVVAGRLEPLVEGTPLNAAAGQLTLELKAKSGVVYRYTFSD